jgi:small ligand-binding sensory domain FIST
VTFAAALSQHPLPSEAVGEVVGQVLEQLGESGCDLVVVFASPHHTGAFEDITRALVELIEPRIMIGGTAVSVAGGGREVEDAPALSVLAGRLPESRLVPVALDVVEGPGGAGLSGWPELGPDEFSSLLLFADPFSFPTDGFLRHVEKIAPGVQIIGGLASAANGPGGNRLVVHGLDAATDPAETSVRTSGAVGVLVDTGIEIRTLVSQGCRPVGQPLVVTRSERNFIQELAGEPPLQRLRDLATAAGPEERELMGRGLHLGVVVDEHQPDFARGDFLVRNVLGADEATGAIAVGAEVSVGQTVQFHVRDAGSADEDLRVLLSAADGPTRGALLFTCNGRGQHLFGTPDHDAGLIEQLLGPLPLAGAFCAGEIGPVGGRNFLHGFTASVALFGASAAGATNT